MSIFLATEHKRSNRNPRRSVRRLFQQSRHEGRKCIGETFGREDPWIELACCCSEGNGRGRRNAIIPYSGLVSY